MIKYIHDYAKNVYGFKSGNLRSYTMKTRTINKPTSGLITTIYSTINIIKCQSLSNINIYQQSAHL